MSYHTSTTISASPAQEHNSQRPHLKMLKQLLPIEEPLRQQIDASRHTLKSILDNNDERIFLIVGPCALQSLESALEYANKLNCLQNDISDHFILVMRAYYEKSRSFLGWKGLMYSSSEDQSIPPSFSSLYEARAVLKTLAETGLPLAAEIVDPFAAPFFYDCLSWASIGARTSYSQPHRMLASNLPMACGIKNPVDGSISAACAAIGVAATPHVFLGTTDEGTVDWISSRGNTHAHLVLRGGHQGPNYSSDHIAKASRRLRQLELPPSVVIDCSHGNSQGDHRRQIDIFDNVLQHLLVERSSTAHLSVKGLMLEGFFQEGSLRDRNLAALPNDLLKYTSWVDPCLDWKSTEALIRKWHTLFSTTKSH